MQMYLKRCVRFLATHSWRVFRAPASPAKMARRIRWAEAHGFALTETFAAFERYLRAALLDRHIFRSPGKAVQPDPFYNFPFPSGWTDHETGRQARRWDRFSERT